MDQMPLVAFVFQSLPESAILYYLASLFTGRKFSLAQIAVMAVIHSSASVILRWWFVFPLYTVLLVVLMLILLQIIAKVNWPDSFYISTAVTFMLFLAEGVSGSLITMITGKTTGELLQHTLARTLLPWPHMAAIWLFTYLGWKKGFDIKLRR